MDRSRCNASRYVPGDRTGHYESWFQRANHAQRPLAFWVRYTVFSPKGRPDLAVGELWAIHFDGERGRITAAKQVVPIGDCSFARDRLDVRIGSAVLSDGRLSGRAATGTSELRWDFRFSGGDAPLLLLAEPWYERGFPKAKALVGTPNAVFDGEWVVDGERIEIANWIGSQNHNWGSRHTDSYAWGQVCGFDGASGTFLECSTARLKLGPLAVPPLTVAVLRLEGRELRLNALGHAFRAEASFDVTRWSFRTEAGDVRVSARFEAAPSSFVGLAYANPPGGTKTCLNTKLASCELLVEEPGRPERRLVSRQRAAFEILTDRNDHGIPVVA